jgi:HSP20 family protein
MTETKSVAETEKAKAAKPNEPMPAIQPPVDICEDADGISLMADMPGVSRERLNIQVDKETLLIEGEAKIDMPEGIQPLYADVRATRYRRTFALSRELDTDNIDASLVNGVLKLRIHKRPESKPRKIEVVTG